MFDSASVVHHLSAQRYEREVRTLRTKLLEAQFRLAEDKRFPVLLLVSGVEGGGKRETVNLLNEWMDPRRIRTHAFEEPTREERKYPPLWRLWQRLPPKGTIGIFFGGPYVVPVVQRARRLISKAALEVEIARIRRFEQLLTDEGTLLLKFWFHLSQKQQRARLEELESSKKTRWRVGPHEWMYLESYDRYTGTAEHVIRATSTGDAPWVIVPGADPRYRALVAGKTLLDSLEERLSEKRPARAPTTAAPRAARIDELDVVRALDLSQSLSREQYEKALEKWQGRLAIASRNPRLKDFAVVAVFEGQDAGGKGGAIRRITQALDARAYEGVSIAAPTEEERAQPYLWRFWRNLPSRGRFTLFDRSWYGRVLVERVEGLCTEFDWMRAYGEINDFEAQLIENGTVVVKFWLAISKEEQNKRFRAREGTPFKKWKITPEDYRNRKKWDAYQLAVSDMIDATSTEVAPWTLVEANDKHFARIKVLKTLVKAVEARLEKG